MPCFLMTDFFISDSMLLISQVSNKLPVGPRCSNFGRLYAISDNAVTYLSVTVLSKAICCAGSVSNKNFTNAASPERCGAIGDFSSNEVIAPLHFYL